MDTPRNKLTEILKEGNKYVFYFLGIFLFIYFVIVIPYKHPVKDVAIEDETVSVGQQLAALSDTINVIENKKAKASPDSVKYFNQQIFELKDAKIKYQKEIVDLSSKKPERTFSIPLLGISITETIILSTYPGFLLVGICLSLFYRRKFFKLIPQLRETEKKDIVYPIWSFPIPYTFNRASVFSWIATNTIGILCHFVLIYLVLDFVFYILNVKVGTGQIELDEIYVIDIFIALVALAFYMWTIIDLIICEWKRKKI